MVEGTYICQQCRHVFRLPESGGQLPGKGVKCPNCGSLDTGELPSWAPIGFGLSQGPSVWECECQQCQKVFKVPVPSSPSEQKEITCPTCGGRHIHRLTAIGGVPMYCG